MCVNSRSQHSSDPRYRGRFAPSPTGPLHIGSVVSALGSYLEAHRAQGLWLLRIDDIDQSRQVKGAVSQIFRQLEALGLEWDGTPEYQSTHLERYSEAFAQLKAKELLFGCACSRRDIAGASTGIDGSVIYPGYCRQGIRNGRSARSWRVRVAGDIDFIDQLQGVQHQHLPRDTGDFIVWRADQSYAYQLAVVADDAANNITHVVRGADLLHSTPRQIYLQQQLGYAIPHYMHLPIITNNQGEKLSKQTQATAIIPSQAHHALWLALTLLGQAPPATLYHAPPREIIAWALAHWQTQGLQDRTTIELASHHMPTN